MCYKSGGCGIYENLSCSECPASDPGYVKRENRVAVGIYDEAMTVELTREQIKKIIIDYYREEGENE
jgi:hypothetical protein